jgi:hypothetical protein
LSEQPKYGNRLVILPCEPVPPYDLKAILKVGVKANARRDSRDHHRQGTAPAVESRRAVFGSLVTLAISAIVKAKPTRSLPLVMAATSWGLAELLQTV